MTNEDASEQKERSMRDAMKCLVMILMAAALMLALPGAVKAAENPAEIDPGDVLLAERVAEIARMTVSGRALTAAHFKMAGAMLEAAAKLNPTEPRFPRLWNDAMLRVVDSAGALRALKAYIAIDGEDKPALIELTDLYASSYETLDKRMDYLRDWVDDARLPDEVRSHIAVMAFKAYLERAQGAQAKAMLEQALRLNPLSLEALRARYEQLAPPDAPAVGTPFERVGTLLAMLRSNPNQINYVGRVAQELAELGMAQPAIQFFSLSFNLAKAQGIGIPRDPALAYAIELVLINQPAAAKQLVDSLAAANPADYELLVLRLLIERALEQKEAAAKSGQQVQTVLLNRLQEIRRAMGDKAATTRPVDSALPVEWGSFASDIKQLKELKSDDASRLRSDFEQTLTEIAWFQLYFNQSPADAKPTLEALKQLLPENSPLLARLEGWSFLARRENDAAKVKLSAVKDQDPLAELGLIRLMGAAASQKEGEQLLSRHPAGLLGALILDALRDRKVTLVPSSEVAGPMTEVLAKFSTEWLGILDQPQRFYTLRLDPLKIAHAYGEPVLMRVTIQNISEYPITIGPEGVLHPDLWFDANFRGVVQQNVQGAGYDKLWHEVVLQPRGVVSQVVRVDQGPVAQILSNSPFPAMQVIVTVRTNPSTAAQSGVGPAGQMVQASKFFERNAFSLSQASMTGLGQSMQQGGPAEKIRSIDLAASTALILSQQQSNDDAKRVTAHLVELLQSLSRDSSPSVQAWAGATLARIAAGPDRPIVVNRLINDPLWISRLLGLASMGTMKLEEQRAIVKQVAAHDTDPIVVQFANAIEELLATVTTNPSTRPAVGPATEPATQPVAPSPFGPSIFGPLLVPGTQPTTRPAGPDLVIPSLPLALPPSTQPEKPAGTKP